MKKGEKMTEKQRLKISEALLGKKKKYQVWNKGKTGIYSDDTKKKMGYWSGKKMPKSIREKMSENHRTKNGYCSGMKGKHQTEYQKKIMSKISSGNKYAKGNKPNKTSFKKGQKPWNKGKEFSAEVRKKMSENKRDEKNHGWKGDNAKYGTKHDWVRTRRGPARSHICQICGKKQAQDWANKDHKYKRNLEDWMALCRKCHRDYDIKNN